MRRQNIMLTAWLIGPLAVLVAIMWGVVLSLRNPPKKMQPVGAGAGSTGSDNSAFRVFGHGDAHPAEAGAAASAEAGAGQPSDVRLMQPELLTQGFVLIVEDKSGLASLASPIYVAGSFNNWNPGDPAFKLSPQSDMRWRVLMPPSKDGKPIEFKFTRGTWDLEELNPDMTQTKNRTLAPVDVVKLAPGEQPKIELSVAHWGDERPNSAGAAKGDAYSPIRATGDLRRVQVSGGAGGAAGTTRELLVWLPPGYDAPQNAGLKYPVLYMHDGQNLFAKHGGIAEEWGLDEAAQELITSGKTRPFIIVGVPHSGEGRLREYLPAALIEGVNPEGETHIAWLRSEVMPRVERTFRIASGAENTGVGGSSLGAVISIAAAARHPDVFGLLYLESLSFGPDRPEWAAVLDRWKTAPRRVFIGVGDDESPNDKVKSAAVLANALALETKLEVAGLGADRLLRVVGEGASHNEAAWGARARAALTFLFPPPLDVTK